LFYFDGTNYRKFANDSAMLANGFKFENVATTAMTINAGGAMVNGAEAGLMTVAMSGSGSVVIIPGGSITAALASDTPASMSIPKSVGVDFLRFNLTAGNDGDATINGIKFTQGGLGNAADMDAVSVYVNGRKFGNSRDIDSNHNAQINFTTPLVIAKGTTQTVLVKATVAGTDQYSLGIASASDIIAANNSVVSGNFPMYGNTMVGVNVTVGKLTVDADGSLAAVKLGDKSAEITKFKITNDNVEDATLTSILLKKDSASTASDTAIENVKLLMDGAVVATATGVSGKYLVFNMTAPVTILKNTVKRFTVTADVIDGASKTLLFVLDSTTDVNATGSYYKSSMQVASAGTMLTNTNSVTINAGAVIIEKLNAPLDKVKKDQTDTVFGTFKVTVNSGKTVEMSKIKLSILTSNDNQSAGTAFTKIENLEIWDKTNNTTYSLDFLSGIATKIYQNTSMGLILNSGVTHELVVRADVKSTAINEDYTVSIVDASGGALVLKETGNDTLLTDITPNTVTLKKVTVETASVLFSTNALADVTSVVGSSDIKMVDFNIKAGQTSDLKVSTLKFKNTASSTGSGVVSEYKLWKNGDSTPVKSVSGSQLSSEEITFSGLNIQVAANTTVNYYMTISLVKDSNNATKQINYYISGYAAEETTKGQAVYDTTNDTGETANDGIIQTGDVGYTASSMRSLKDILLVATGYVTLVADTTGMYAGYVLGGTTSGDLAKFRLKATNEDVSITKLKVTTSASVVGNITRLSLYNDAGTEVAYTTNITASPVELDSISASSPLIVGQAEKVYTLRATYSLIGQGQTGTNNSDVTFKLSNVEAQGYSSGDALANNHDSTLAAGDIAYDAGDTLTNVTAVSLATQSVPGKFSAISLENTASGVSLNTKLTDGTSNNVAIIKVTLPASSNTLIANGNESKVALNKIKVSVAKNAKVLGATYTIERIGGSQAAVAGTNATTTAFAFFDTSSNTDFTQLSSGNTYYFLVKMVPTLNSSVAGDCSVQVGLDALNATTTPTDVNGDSTYGNFDWTPGEATAMRAIRIPGVSTLSGVTISN
ncbi:hypothetical protein GW915_12270, partial [bacterium]|nr:hypothetical protein [bacterium]